MTLAEHLPQLGETLAEALPRDWWRDPAERLLGEVIQRPEWHARAACRGQMRNGESLWFGTSPPERQQARAICASCEVREECRQAGRAVREPYGGEFGVWGGEGRADRGDR